MSTRRDKNRRAPSVMALRAGPAPAVRCDGREWPVGFNDQDAKAELEALVAAHVTRAAVKRKRDVGGPDGDEYFGEFQKLLDAGHYYTFAAGWRYVMAGADASWLFLLSLLRKRAPHATEADAKRLLAEEPEQVAAAVGAVAPDFFEAAIRQIGTDRDATPERVRHAAETIATAVLDNMTGKPKTPAPATG